MGKKKSTNKTLLSNKRLRSSSSAAASKRTVSNKPTSLGSKKVNKKPIKSTTKKGSKSGVRKKVKKGVDPQVLVRRGDSLRYYNIILSSVRTHGRGLSNSEIRSKASSIYLDLKQKYGVGSVPFKFAIENIDEITYQALKLGKVIFDKVDIIDWWVIGQKVNSVPSGTHLVIDGTQIDSSLEFIGNAEKSLRFIPTVNRVMNSIFSREKNNYPKALLVLIRDEANQKELLYCLLVDETSEILEYDADELEQFIRTNFDVESVFEGLEKSETSVLSLVRPSFVGEAVKRELDAQEAIKEAKRAKGRAKRERAKQRLIEKGKKQTKTKSKSKGKESYSDSDKELEIIKEKRALLEEKMKAFNDLVSKGVPAVDALKFVEKTIK